MEEIETLTPEGTEVEIEEQETLEAPAEQVDVAALQAEVAAANEAKAKAEAAEAAAQEKFSASTREAQILAAKNKALEAKSINNQPTEDDLRQSFPEWEYMTDNEKSIAKRTFVAEQIAQEAVADKRQREAEAVWNREVETFTLSDQKLSGREDEFKKFANKPSHRNAPLDVLKSAFLHEMAPVTKVERQPGLEPGSGGPREPAKKTLSGEDLQTLRKTNYEAYKEYVNTHDIEI